MTRRGLTARWTVAASLVVALGQGTSAHAQEGPLARPTPAGDEWTAYAARSRRDEARDRAVMSGELSRAGLQRMTRAPFSEAPFTRTAEMTRAWLAGAGGRAAVAAVRSFQTPTGGWSKHVEMLARARKPGESWFSESDDWQWIGTLDQGATTAQVRFLLAADSARHDAGALDAARRGVEYLLAAQMPGGCWPQVYPLMGGYHDAVATAGDANASALHLLRDVATSRLPRRVRASAATARRRGIACIVRLQRRDALAPTGWALFHDPLDGTPLPGRSFEPAALAPLETAGLLAELLAEPSPDSETMLAAHGAAAWLRRVGLANLRYGQFVLTAVDSGGTLLWPKLVAISGRTGAPLFSNRDGVPRYDWNELTDRRTGYAWFGTEPEAVLERYLDWAATHPATGALAVHPVPTDSVARLPGHSVETDTEPLVSAGRLAHMRPAPRAAWEQYAARSRTAAAVDRAAMGRELAHYGRASMRRPAWAHDFAVSDAMTDEWFASDSARRMAESILSFQTPGGGWSKHVDFSAGVRLPGESFNGESAEWRFIPTIDNASTTEEMRFLARRDRVSPDPRYRESFRRGMRYLLNAQMATGCWPQVFPLQGGYHDAVTFNDDAIVNVAELLTEAGAGEVPFLSGPERGEARGGSERAVGCIASAQVVVRGVRTIWAQQHDPVTLAPAPGRAYELASLGPDESAHVAEFLMRQPNQSASVVRAVHAAADWFRANRIDTLTYSHYTLVHHAGPTPLWGRMVEVGTGRPIFSNRDGRQLYDYDQLTDRRTGYRWFTAAPAAFLSAYERWAATHPRATDASASSPSPPDGSR